MMDREAAKREARRRIDVVRIERGAHAPVFDPLYAALLSEPVSSLVEAFLRTLEERPLLHVVKGEKDV